LASGTYIGKDGNSYDTEGLVDYIRNSRTGTQATLAAWDLGLNLVSAKLADVPDAELQYWIDGVKAEINELADDYYDITGLAGAVYGLAFVGEDIDPTGGMYADANSLSDLADILAGYQINGGGFAWDLSLLVDGEQDMQTTAYAILALNEVDRDKYLTQLQNAADYLLDYQLTNGGWPYYQTYDAGSEYNEVTAEVISAINLVYPMSELDIQYLLDNAPENATVVIPEGTHTLAGGFEVNNPRLTIKLMDGVVIQNNSPCFTVNADYTTITYETIGGATCKPTDGSNGIDVVGDRLNIILEGFEIDGSIGGTHGISFTEILAGDTVTDVVIRDMKMHDLAGSAVHFSNQPEELIEGNNIIQGNLFDMETITGFGVNAPADLDVSYNSWGAWTGPAAEADLPIAITSFTPWTHADLEVIQTGGGTSYPDQVVQDDTITYTVRGDFKNVMGADFVLKYPPEVSVLSTTLGGQFDLEDLITTSPGELHFYGSMIETETAPPSVVLDDQNIDLFSVTFTGDVLGTELVLDVDETTDFFSMAPGFGPSTYVYGTDCVDVTTLEVIALPTIDIIPVPNLDYVAGLPIEFTVLVKNNDGGDYTDLDLDFTLPPGAILEVWNGTSFITVADPYTFDFGSLAVGDETAVLFHVTFVDDGENTISVDLVDNTPEPDVVLVSTSETFTTLGAFNVIGTISMQGRTVRDGVPLTLTDVNGVPIYGPFNTTSTSEISYNVLFSGVDGSIYEITTNQDRYLNVTADLDKQIYVRSAYTIPALELKGGNAVEEGLNKIDISDAAVVGGDYNEIGDLNSDVNFDGKVNIQDLALVGGNYQLTSQSAYEDWLVPEVGGIVSGQIQNTTEPFFAGDLAGEYDLHIEGHFTDFTGFVGTFTGRVTGDIEGDVSGTTNINGVDTLFGEISLDSGGTLHMVGIFPKSGLNGHFYGQIIADYSPTFITSIDVSGEGEVTTVVKDGTLQMLADVSPIEASGDVIWSVWANPATTDETELATIDPNTGMLTALSPGEVVVIAKALDGSHISGQMIVTITAP
jgi:hypothetical protein